MNKTININLGGMLFHIDEDAFAKLTRYIDAIKKSLSNSSGQEEIIKDIEMRIAELFSEKQKNEKTIISLKDLDEVIAIMGQPEDYIIEEETTNSTNYSNYSTNSKSKKLYRDTEKNIIGGVASGLGHYFGIDPVWIRIVLVLLVFGGFGTGLLAYIILWIVMPAALTTSEKLEMKGEPVNISNIEKKVREEFDSVSEKIKNVDYDKYGNQIKTGAGKVGKSFGDFILSVFNVFAKFLGIILIMTGLSSLIMLLIGVFTLGTNSFIHFPWRSFVEAGKFTDYPIWSFGLLLFLAIGIPFVFLSILGFKLLAPNMKSVGNIVKYTLLGIWLIAIALTISIVIQQATAFAFEGKQVKNESFTLKQNDTLFIKFKYNDLYAKNVYDRNDLKILPDSSNTEVIYSNNVRFKIMNTDEKTPYIKIEKEAKGVSILEAKQRAEQIKYQYIIEGNHLILNNYLVTALKNKYRDQEIEISLYLPKGTLFKVDSSVQNYDNSDDNYFNFTSDQYTYQVYDDKIKCIDCPLDEDKQENSNTDENDESITIEINSTDTTNTIKKSNGKLIMNKDGIIIKNK